MGFSYRLHLQTQLAATTPEPVLAWLRGDGDGASLLAAVPSEATRDWLAELRDWRPSMLIELEAVSTWSEADPTPRTAHHLLSLSTRIGDDDVMVVYGLAAMIAPWSAEGMIGVTWTDQHQACDPTLFLVQQGRLYMADRYESPRHVALDGTDEMPWVPFTIGDPELGR